MSMGVDELRAAVTLLGETDPDTLTNNELHQLVITVERLRDQLDISSAQLLGAWDERQVWASNQSRSGVSRLSQEVGCSDQTSRRRLKLVRRLRRMPAATDAVAGGAIHSDVVGLLAGASHHAPAEFVADEASLIATCSTLDYVGAATVVGYWKQAANPDGSAAEADRTVERAAVHASATLDGTVVIDGILDPVGGTIFTTELNRLTKDLRLADKHTGVTRTAAQRRAAALVEMATRSASAPADARRPKPLFTVLLGEDRFTHLCELAAGTIVPPTALRPYFDDADLESMLFDGHNNAVTVSQRRNFTGTLRRVIEARDRHCQHPSGCYVPAADCDVDHIIRFPESGRTDQFNGRLECPTHNRHADKHDHDAAPRPFIDITPLYIAYARLRWHFRHLHTGDSENGDGDSDGESDSTASAA